MRNTLAPIILFVFNRLEHTINTLEALKKNILAEDSNLIIYSDAANKKKDRKKVDQVRKYISNISGFKSVKIIKRKKNYGLARSIKNGITKVIYKYKKAIILEDDILTSKFFLNFMNDSLNFYRNNKKIWHINGWNYPNFKNNKKDVYADRMMNCWGWATWKDRWDMINYDIDKIIDLFDKKKIFKFNLNQNEDFFSHLIANKENKIKTWAIFWQASIFLKNGLCIRPSVSYTNNIGMDNSGTHCSNEIINFYMHKKLNDKKKNNFIDFKKENINSIKKIISFYSKKNSLFVRYTNRIYQIIINFFRKFKLEN